MQKKSQNSIFKMQFIIKVMLEFKQSLWWNSPRLFKIYLFYFFFGVKFYQKLNMLTMLCIIILNVIMLGVVVPWKTENSSCFNNQLEVKMINGSYVLSHYYYLHYTITNLKANLFYKTLKSLTLRPGTWLLILTISA